MRLRLVPLLLCASLFAAPACVSDGGNAGAKKGAPVLDETVLAFLSKARAAHHAADLHERGGDLAGVVRDLETITGGPRPTITPEVEEVLADAYARLAEVKSRRAAWSEALADVDAGLGLARDDSHFRGHLYEVKGLVLERQYEAQALEGKADLAAATKESALQAFEEAIDVQERVIQKALSPAPEGSVR